MANRSGYDVVVDVDAEVRLSIMSYHYSVLRMENLLIMLYKKWLLLTNGYIHRATWGIQTYRKTWSFIHPVCILLHIRPGVVLDKRELIKRAI